MRAVGGKGWAWTGGGRKWNVWVVRAVWAVGVGHRLKPVKDCFSRRGAGGGEGVGGVGGGGWAWTGARKTLLFMAGALRWGR